MPEFWIPGPGQKFGDAQTLGRYADLTFKMPNGSIVHVQTVDTDRNGEPTDREWKAARWIKAMTGSDVYLIPKPGRKR